MRTSYPLLGTLMLSLLLSACGGGGSNGNEWAVLAALAAAGTPTSTSTNNGASTVDPGTAGPSVPEPGSAGPSTGTGGTTTDTSGPSTIRIKTLLTVNAEESGVHCGGGGVRIDAGLDSDGNGQLSASEVGNTQYMCQDVAGLSGTLVQMRDEPRGANCAAAGKVIHVGVDGDGNRMLEAAEIRGTGYVCNGADGSIVASESNMLASVVSDATAANCAGGSKVVAGVDGNANGVLEADEVSATSYICNCAGGPRVDVAGPAVQAQPNTCYIARNATAQVVVTLPAAPAIGDVVRVRGAGLGGWKIAQNPGQAVDTKSLGGMAGANWTVRDSNLPWATTNPAGFPIDRRRVVFSADGSKLAASVFDGYLYTSTDNGASWTAHESNRRWASIASSADGTKLVALDGELGHIYTSTDSGVSWTARGDSRPWVSVASSADGSKLVAAPERGGQLYTSTDGGISWTARESIRSWSSVASSADGRKLVAAAQGGQIYTSTDGGISWTARESAKDWTSVASSADGSKLVAVAFFGPIYTSTDSGVTWTARGESDLYWTSVASSGDGAKLAAVASGGQIYTSIDSGVSWIARESNRTWYWVAASADASRMVAIADGSQIFVSEASTTLGAEGSIGGSSSDSIDLQYAGNGQFIVLSHEGSLTIQ